MFSLLIFSHILQAQSLSVGYNRIMNENVFQWFSDTPTQSNGVSISYQKKHKKRTYADIQYHFISGQSQHDLSSFSAIFYGVENTRSYSSAAHIVQLGYGLRLPVRKLRTAFLLGASFGLGVQNINSSMRLYYEDGTGTFLDATDTYAVRGHWTAMNGINLGVEVQVHPRLAIFLSANAMYSNAKPKEKRITKNETPVENFPPFSRDIVIHNRSLTTAFDKAYYDFFQMGIKYQLSAKE